MKLLALRPILWVNDVRATIDWYVNTLGFTETAYREDLQWGEVTKDCVVFMFSKPNEHVSYNGPQFSGSLYINIGEVDILWEKLKDSPHVYYGLENFEYEMREFAIKDCNGYILQFGQDLVNEADH